MKERIKTADINLEVIIKNQMGIEINSLNFILGEDFSWITVRTSLNGDFH